MSDVDGGTLDGSSFDADETWGDPLIGLKGQVNIAAGFYATGLAHAGGFGAASDLTWDAFGGFRCRYPARWRHARKPRSLAPGDYTHPSGILPRNS